MNTIEKQITRYMIRALDVIGFKPIKVDEFRVKNQREVIEWVEQVGEARVVFSNGEKRHTVLLVPGNDVDIITDWNFSVGDPDGFSAAMDAVLDWINERFE